MGAKGATPWGGDMDDSVFVPLTTGSLRLFGGRDLRSITVEVDSAGNLPAVQDAVSELLAARHGGVRDFRIRDMASYIETAAETRSTFTLLLGSVASFPMYSLSTKKNARRVLSPWRPISAVSLARGS